MSDGGYAALQQALAKGGARRPRLVSFDHPPGDWTGVTVGLQYEDGEGRVSRRWVTIQSLDPDALTMKAYCWARNALRTFRLDRIQEAIDGDGEMLGDDDFLEAMGIPPIRKLDVTVPSRMAPQSSSMVDAASGFSAWSKQAPRTGRQEGNVLKASMKSQPIPVQIAGGLIFAAILLGFVWLFF